jgi:hypothetical protein
VRRAHPGAAVLLCELIERSRRDYVSPIDLAIAFTGIGDTIPRWIASSLQPARDALLHGR